MDGQDLTLTGALPSGFWFLGELLFRWVPASVIAVRGDFATTSPVFGTPTEPLSIWDISNLLASASHPSTYDALIRGWATFSVLMFTFALPFAALAIYCSIRIMQIRRQERLAFRAAQRPVVSQDVPRTQLRWNRVLDQASASSPESWRLAILEADIMLNEVLDLRGYKGETMADKMKQVDRINFNTIDLAWEAHKIRNRIAHDGSAHELSPREARRVIALYERVFKEFKYVE